MPPHSGDAIITFSFLDLAINLGSVWSPLILYILHEILITNQNYSYLKWRHVQSRPHYKRLMILDTRILCITESKYYHQLYSQNRNDYLPINGNNANLTSSKQHQSFPYVITQHLLLLFLAMKVSETEI